MNTSWFRLDGQVALITGASQGIGYGLAKAFAEAGAIVVACARTLHLLNTLVEEITVAGGKAVACELDVTNMHSISVVFQTVKQDFGRLDILVNNAGLGTNHNTLEVTEEDWDAIMAVNQKGLFFCCQAAGKIMIPQGYGRIINMSSQASIVGIPHHAVYCTSKGGVNQLTKVLALEWAPAGITVNAIGPTFIRTPGTAERLNDPSYLQTILTHIPVGKVGTIRDVASAAIYLASPEAAMVNGTLLLVDGGWTAS